VYFLGGYLVRIAISTLIDYFNYGNRLQNYALQEVLKKMGNEVYTIKDYTDLVGKRSIRVRVLNSIKKGHILNRFVKKVKRIGKNTNNTLNEVRKNNFINFTNKYIKETDFYINQNTTDFSFENNFDCFVIGSDQVWNYMFQTSFLFSFVEYTKKPKISYAASFGVNSIPKNYLASYKKGLNSVDIISVRENEGKKIVDQLSNKSATVVLDPTLLLTMDEWKKVIDGKKKYKEKYVLTYFLDNPDKNTMQYINSFVRDRNFVIKNLYSDKYPELWTADPAEFVNLISQAEAIFTDSFHGCVFSIIFQRYFEVFDRNNNGPSMNSRIDTLFNELDLMDRWHRNDIRKTIDYSKVEDKLKNKRNESLNFLKESLENVKNMEKIDLK